MSKGKVTYLFPAWPNVRCTNCHRISTVKPDTSISPWKCPFCKGDRYMTSLRSR